MQYVDCKTNQGEHEGRGPAEREGELRAVQGRACKTSQGEHEGRGPAEREGGELRAVQGRACKTSQGAHKGASPEPCKEKTSQGACTRGSCSHTGILHAAKAKMFNSCRKSSFLDNAHQD